MIVFFRYFLKACLVCFWVLLIGCVSQSSIGPVTPDDTKNSVSLADRPEPVRAVKQMIDESNRLLSVQDWEEAIAIAERGMRIDRRVPDLYLAIARGYEGLQDFDRAKQFATQGLRFVADKNGDVALSLQRLTLQAPR